MEAPLSSVKPTSFSGVIRAIGFSNGLSLIFVATVIWGFFPLFYDHSVILLADRNALLFLSLRYASALPVSVVLLAILSALVRRNQHNGLGTMKKSPRFVFTLFMGMFLFLARLLEYMAYGADGRYASFAMIFSVFFVLLWDWKSWILGSLYATLQAKGNRFAIYVAPFAQKGPGPIGFIIWSIQALLTLTAGLFFVYAQDGRLLSLDQPAAVSSILLSLLSALCLSFFFDIMLVFKDDSLSTLAQLKNTVKAQATASLGLLAFAFASYLAFSRGNTVADFAFMRTTISAWATESSLSFFMGIVVLGTCVAYVLENVGAILHDRKKEFGDWKIAGREWTSITSCVDPLIAVSFVVPLLSLLQARSDSPQEPFWLVIPAAGVLGVAMANFLKVWSKKQSEIRQETYAYVSQLEATDDDDRLAQVLWQSRLTIFEKAEGYDGLLVSCWKGLVTGYDHRLDDRLAARSGAAEFAKHAMHSLLLSQDIPFGGEPRLDVFFILGGKKLFNPLNIETKSLFEAHRNWILRDSASRLFSPDELVKVMKDTYLTAQTIDYDLAVVSDGLKELGLPNCDATQRKGALVLFHFTSSSERNTPSLPTSEFRSTWFISRGSDIEATKDSTWRSILPLQRYWRMKDLKSHIDEYRRDGFYLASDDLNIVRRLPPECTDQTHEWVFLESELICEEEPVPKWLVRYGTAASTKKVVLFARQDISGTAGSLLAGAADTSPANLPIVSNVGEDDSRCLGGTMFRKAMTVALWRSGLRIEVIIIDDIEEDREVVRRRILVPLIGTSATVFCPKNAKEVVQCLEKSTFPLVLFKPNLDRWADASDTSDLIRPFLSKCDPYVLIGSGQYGLQWPKARLISRDLRSLARCVVKHVGLKGNMDVLGSRFEQTDVIAEQWKRILTRLNQEIQDGSLGRNCYGLFLEYGRERKLRTS